MRVLFQAHSSRHSNYSPLKKSHWKLYKSECSSHQLLREAAERAFVTWRVRADKIPSSLCFNTAVLQSPGKHSWYSTKLAQVSPVFLKRILCARQHHQERSWCRSPACRICCRCSLRGKEGSNDLCMSWMTSTKGRCMDFWHHTHYILAQIRWNCSGSQSSCHHQLQDTYSTLESLWTGKDWEWQCPADTSSGSPFHCCMVGWSWMSTGLCPTFLLIHPCWLVPSHSHWRVARSAAAPRQTHHGDCTQVTTAPQETGQPK